MRSIDEIAKLWRELTDDERIAVHAALRAGGGLWVPLPGPQLLARRSEAQIIGYGGAGGGGKSAFIAGLAATEHHRTLICRNEQAQTMGIQRELNRIVGSWEGHSKQPPFWKIGRAEIEFAGLKDLGDEQRHQGRAHDLLALDEATEIREVQARFLMGWVRHEDPNQRKRVVLTFNPPMTEEGRWVLRFFGPWLDRRHPNPAKPGELRWFTSHLGCDDYEVPDGRQFVWSGPGEDAVPVYDFDPKEVAPTSIITPVSRTFFAARVTDNPYYMRSGYVAQMQSLPEPLRSRLLDGSFDAGVLDDPWQVIPTAWVEAAMERWKPWTGTEKPPPMGVMGVDVARGGRDRTIIARRHGDWFDAPIVLPGTQSPDGFAVVAEIMKHRRDNAPIAIDVVGVGSSPYDILRQQGIQTVGVVAGATPSRAPIGFSMQFANVRSELIWGIREALDPKNGRRIALPPDRRLLADLCSFLWKPQGDKIQVVSREDIIKRIGRSPDWGSAYAMAFLEIVKARDLEAMQAKISGRNSRLNYDPFRGL